MTTAHEAWMHVMDDVREIRKDELNKFQGFNFRGIDAVMNAVGPIFRRHGVSCIPARIVDSKHRDFETDKGKLQHEAIVTVEYRVTGPEGDSFLGESIGEASDTSDKATTQAMSVAYRTFLLQGLTMPTDQPDPDENTVTRGTPDQPEWVAGGWDSAEKQADAWSKIVATLKELPDSPEKDALRALVKENGMASDTITKAQANNLYKQAVALAESAEPVGGWKSKAERDRTYKSLMSRIGKMPAFESEHVSEFMASIGVTDMESFTAEQAKELLSVVEEAEEMAKGDAS